MGNLEGFNANEVEPSRGFTPVPDGKYLAMITKSQLKENNAQNGEYLELEFQIIEGEHKNRKVYTRLNLKNPSQEAVAIGKGNLSAICRAVDVMVPGHSSNLHNMPMTILVKTEMFNGKPNSEIKGFMPKSDYEMQGAKPSWMNSN